MLMNKAANTDDADTQLLFMSVKSTLKVATDNYVSIVELTRRVMDLEARLNKLDGSKGT